MPDAAPLPGELAGLDVVAYMREALVEAEAAGRAGEVPIGAVLVVDGVIVSRGRARHRATRSQLMHAEMQALLHGGAPLWERYDDAVLVTTLEPCPMCLGAVVMADVPHVVFALPDTVAGSRRLVDTIPYIRRHIRTYQGGILRGRSGCAVRALRSGHTRLCADGCIRRMTTRTVRECCFDCARGSSLHAGGPMARKGARSDR